MIFDDVVKPILYETLAGYNCTIFAYGQTGTGKTYTISGDMAETLSLLSDAAGIIPRVLHALFNKLEINDTENCVKCSFLELYNEELRDLISVEENAKLKIYNDTSRRDVLRWSRHGREASQNRPRRNQGPSRWEPEASGCGNPPCDEREGRT